MSPRHGIPPIAARVRMRMGVGVSALALAIASGAACHDRDPRGRRARHAPAAVVSDAAPPPVDLPRAIADARYHGLGEILADRDHARGRIAVVPIRRGFVNAADFTAIPCDDDRGDDSRYFLNLPAGGADAVRAVPHHTRTAPCARAVIRILWVDSEGFTGGPAPDGGWQVTPDVAQIVAGDTLGILDVTPEPPAPAPAGVDFTRLVDVGLARRTDRPVVVELPLRVVHGLVGTGVTTETCDTRELVFFNDERPDGALAAMSGCRTVRGAILPDDGIHMSDDPLYGATLISIGAPVRESP